MGAPARAQRAAMRWLAGPRGLTLPANATRWARAKHRVFWWLWLRQDRRRPSHGVSMGEHTTGPAVAQDGGLVHGSDVERSVEADRLLREGRWHGEGEDRWYG